MRLALAIAALLMAAATLLYATHRRAPEYVWDEPDDGVQGWDVPPAWPPCNVPITAGWWRDGRTGEWTGPRW